jgi:hypothetical protein
MWLIHHLHKPRWVRLWRPAPWAVQRGRALLQDLIMMTLRTLNLTQRRMLSRSWGCHSLTMRLLSCPRNLHRHEGVVHWTVGYSRHRSHSTQTGSSCVRLGDGNILCVLWRWLDVWLDFVYCAFMWMYCNLVVYVIMWYLWLSLYCDFMSLCALCHK